MSQDQTEIERDRLCPYMSHYLLTSVHLRGEYIFEETYMRFTPLDKKYGESGTRILLSGILQNVIYDPTENVLQQIQYRNKNQEFLNVLVLKYVIFF
jgi:hypothetical protein